MTTQSAPQVAARVTHWSQSLEYSLALTQPLERKLDSGRSANFCARAKEADNAIAGISFVEIVRRVVAVF